MKCVLPALLSFLLLIGGSVPPTTAWETNLEIGESCDQGWQCSSGICDVQNGCADDLLPDLARCSGSGDQCQSGKCAKFEAYPNSENLNRRMCCIGGEAVYVDFSIKVVCANLPPGSRCAGENKICASGWCGSDDRCTSRPPTPRPPAPSPPAATAASDLVTREVCDSSFYRCVANCCQNLFNDKCWNCNQCCIAASDACHAGEAGLEGYNKCGDGPQLRPTPRPPTPRPPTPRPPTRKPPTPVPPTPVPRTPRPPTSRPPTPRPPTPRPPTTPQTKYNFYVSNNCQSTTIWLAIRYLGTRGLWVSDCWWDFDPGKHGYLSSDGQRLEATYREWYFYAEVFDGSNDKTRSCLGHDFTKLDFVDSDGDLSLDFSCPDESKPSFDESTSVPEPTMKPTLDGPAMEQEPTTSATIEATCTNNSDCSDDLDCTIDLCGDNGVCSHIPADNLCEDDFVCDIMEGCSEPTISATEIMCTTNSDCSDNLDCTIDLCGDNGVCSHTPADNLCEDDFVCDIMEGCSEPTISATEDVAPQSANDSSGGSCYSYVAAASAAATFALAICLLV